MPSSPESLVRRYAHLVRADDTAGRLAARIGKSSSLAKQILAAVRKEAVPEPAHQPSGVEVSDTEDGIEVSSVNEVIQNPEQMLAAAGVDLAKWEVVDARVSTSATAMRGRKVAGPDGQVVEEEPRVVRLWHVRARLRPRLVPLVPLADWLPPPPFHMDPPRRPEGGRTAVLLPDMQVGFRWDFDAARPWLRPCHDRAAIDAALQVLAVEQPTDVVLLGDMLDFASLSTRWTGQRGTEETARPALMEIRWLLHRIRELAGGARIVYLEGNHEERLSRYLDERAPALRGLVPGLPELLGLESLGVEWVPYRDQAWLWGRIRLVHGEVVRQGGGATAAAVVKGETHSTVYGHVHRCELAYRRITGPDGASTVFAMSPGSLCLPGETPGSTPRSDWQQGVGVIHSAEGLADTPSVIEIRKGKALHRGVVVQGRDYVEDLVASSGNEAFMSAGS